MQFPGITIGLRHTLERTIGEAEIIGNFWHSAVDNLLSTPALISMMVEASTGLVDARLPEEFISVGKRSEVVHEHPSVLGAHLRLTMEITGFDGYHIELSMHAEDDSGSVAHGLHVRSIVNKRWLQVKINKRISETLHTVGGHRP